MPPIPATETIEQRVAAIVTERILQTGPDFTIDNDLYDAGLDSLAIMQLLLNLEEEFQLSLPVESVSSENFRTIRTVAALVKSRFPEDSPEFAAAPTEPAPEPAVAAPAPVAEPLIDTPVPQPIQPTRAVSPPPPAYVPPKAGTSLGKLQGCDYFVLSFDEMSRRTGQGGHKAHSFLVLDRLPDIAQLRAVLAQAARRHPILNAQIVRPRPFAVPEWTAATDPQPPELNLYYEKGSAGTLAAQGGMLCDSEAEVSDVIVNTPLPRPLKTHWPKARFSLIEKRDGGATLIFSWSHLMVDGIGAELFLEEIVRLSSGQSSLADSFVDDTAPTKGWKEYLDAARPMVKQLQDLITRPFDCLGPKRPTAGKTHFETFTLTPEQTRTANQNCAKLCGLMNLPFYLGAVARAHARIFALRGLDPASHVCSVPVQTRRKGAVGPIFQNHLTMFFGAVGKEKMGSLQDAAGVLMEQQSRYLKDRLGEALNGLMSLMSFLPPRLYMGFISMQMRGPFASFFHSHTGEFAPGLNQFLGAKVLSAFHVPGIGTPPGTGIFLNEKNGSMVITICWHETALSEEDRRLMVDQLFSDFGLK